MTTELKVKHTPGPWKLVWQEPPIVSYAGWTVKQDDKIQFPIANIPQTLGGTHSPQKANAALIVTAPDLLEAGISLALEARHLIKTKHGGEFLLERVKKMEAAIARAEGKNV